MEEYLFFVLLLNGIFKGIQGQFFSIGTYWTFSYLMFYRCKRVKSFMLAIYTLKSGLKMRRASLLDFLNVQKANEALILNFGIFLSAVL